ncbi:fungal specific transcription factor domain-containing protein [Rutstroemia sp. NJR-2017a WRK4]|nr:fungal specific transcription factor domain-containing protein [Rutstroemia sp. NJR-2017a WRK4]
MLELRKLKQTIVSALGYSKSNAGHHTTLGIFKKIENEVNDAAQLMSNDCLVAAEHNGIREEYKSLIRQLPSDHTSRCFWRHISMKNFPQIFNSFPPYFSRPLQWLLQFQQLDYDPSLDALKYAAGMSFDDLAADYSESGVSILSLLGKRNITLVTVQAGFVRTAYLKYSGMVAESWHSLSQTIRDPQEIDLQKDNFDVQRHHLPEEGFAHLWHQQLRRRTWLALSLWDIHLGN